MNSLSQYIIEKFQVSKDNIRQYAYIPKDKDELIEAIRDKTKKEGYGSKDNPLNLNDIDTSKITDMSNLFDALDGELKILAIRGCFDVADWNVSNVKDMSYMFYGSNFNGDISDWDVSNVEDMGAMFNRSMFDGDLSDWNVHNVRDMSFMFSGSAFSGKNGNISKWDVSNVKTASWMFFSSKFNCNIDNWNIKNGTYKNAMFKNSPIENNPPKWYNA